MKNILATSPTNLAMQIESVCDAFERVWANGTPPRIEEFLDRVDASQRLELLGELIQIDCEWRRKAKQKPKRDDYAKRFPELGAELDPLFPDDKRRTVTVEQFSQQVSSSGLMTEAALQAWLKSQDKWPSDGEQLARALIKHKLLTKFQAEQIYAGKGKSLVLGNYVILDKLGQGGMGMVLKATHTRMDRLVALKVISGEALKSPDAVKRFHREVQAAAKLTHPNIVVAHDADEANKTHFLVMEYVEGDDLSSLVKKNKGPLSVYAALDAMIQAARGLEYAHKQGVIHRDIKPSNLLLNKEGTIKILDMGLARIESNELGATQADLTGSGAMLGTVDYMSPEQAEDTKHADARSDIYSLGCSLYYLLTARPVYAGDTMMKKLLAHREAPLPSLVSGTALAAGGGSGPLAAGDSQPIAPASPVASAIPLTTLNAVFHKMIAKKASDRYQNMTEVIAALEQCRAYNAPAVSRPSDAEAGSSNELRQFLHEMTGDHANADDGAAEPHTHETMSSAAGEAKTDASRMGLRPDPDRKVGTESQPTRRITTAVAIGLAAVLLVVAAAVIIVKTNRGTLRIEITDPQIEVTVQGTDIVVKDEGQEDIRLEPGEHTLHVKRGNLEFDTDAFTLKKGEVVAVKVELVGRIVRAMNADKLLGQREEAKRKTTVTGWHGWPADAPPPAIVPFNADAAKEHQAMWAKYLKVPVDYTNSIGMKFILIPPGEFMMGSAPTEIAAALKDAGEDTHWQECIKSEAPQHKVILTQPIYLGIHEVTQADYEKVMGKNPSHFAAMGMGKKAVAGMDTTSHPVENVSWNDAAEFCAKLSQQEKLKPFSFRAGETITPLNGTGYRLPTEAEWEFACRSGITTRFWIGDKDEDLEWAGWFGTKAGSRTHAVSELKANPFGVFDIHGNIWEWVQDGWEPTYYGEFQDKPAVNPNAPFSAGSQRVHRGGGWSHSSASCRASERGATVPTSRHFNLGFRVSLVVDAVKAAIAERTIKPAPPTAILPFDAAQAKVHQEAWAKHCGVPVIEEVALPGGQKMSFSLIPPGEFDMAPNYRVRISQPFQMGRYEVTLAQFRAFVEATGYQTSVERSGRGGTARWEGKEEARPEFTWRHESVAHGDDYPVGQVSWNDAVAYCQWLTQQTGDVYRLPSDAEWKWSCRAGSTTKFPFSDAALLPDYCWYIKNAQDTSHPVGLKRPNAWGLHDMLGNIGEYSHDWAADNSPQGTAVDPFGPATGTFRSIRGGSCLDSDPHVDIWGGLSADGSHFIVGFRVVRELDASKTNPLPTPPKK